MGDAVVRKSDESRALWMLGGLYEIMISADDSGGAATVMRMTVPAGTGSPPHTHPGEETLYVVDGEVDMHIGDDVVHAGPGAVFHFPRGTREFFEATKQQATVLVTYTPGGIDRFFAEVGEPASSRTLPPPSDQPPDFERIVRVAAEHGMVIEAP